MSDWLQPLWNFFTPDGANQSSMDNKQVSKANYNSFGRKSEIYANKILYPTAQKASRVIYSEVNPTTPTGTTALPYEEVLTMMEGTEGESRILVKGVKAVDKLGVKPTIGINRYVFYRNDICIKIKR